MKVYVSECLHPPEEACKQCLAKADSLFFKMSSFSALATVFSGVACGLQFPLLHQPVKMRNSQLSTTSSTANRMRKQPHMTLTYPSVKQQGCLHRVLDV